MMKHKRGFWIVILVTFLPLSLLADEKGGSAETWLSNWKEFNPADLRSLVELPSDRRKNSENRKLMKLILQAGVKKDGSFQHLLKRKDLREANNVDLALSAYDYMLNKSEAALNRILAQLATEDIGADVDTTLVLAFVDEWDRTIRAVRKHFYRTDGAGGTNRHFFQTTRAYLYPKKYAAMREVIEAPVVWPGRLLPQKP